MSLILSGDASSRFSSFRSRCATFLQHDNMNSVFTVPRSCHRGDQLRAAGSPASGSCMSRSHGARRRSGSSRRAGVLLWAKNCNYPVLWPEATALLWWCYERGMMFLVLMSSRIATKEDKTLKGKI